MTCKTARVAREDRRALGKRPAAELRALIVAKRLFEFRRRVHDKRPVLRDGLADRTALQEKNFCGAVRRFDCRRPI